MRKTQEKKIFDFNPFDVKEINEAGNRVKLTNAFTRFNDREIHQSIPDYFERQVAWKFKENIAIKTGNHVLTYRQLNKISNQVGRAICDSRGKETGGAALLLEQGIDMITGLVGALKANKFYVPLDPTYPPDRLIYMLKDSNAKILLTNNKNITFAKELNNKVSNQIKIINISAMESDLHGDNLGLEILPQSPAYILYTSGSTGVPKGVLQTHGNVLHFIRSYTNNLHIHSGDRLTLLSSYSFDAAIMDIFGALLNGAALYPFNIMGDGNFERFPQWLERERITIYHSIPTVYRYLVDVINDGRAGSGNDSKRFRNLRLIVLGGEAVVKKDIEYYRQYFDRNCIFVNGLGPTESTVTLQYFIDKETIDTGDAIPVGFPVSETSVMILKGNNREAQVFEPGVIVYKSDYLAPGYVNKPGKTAESFAIDPLTGNGRVFLTGDLGKRLEDGNIEFLGREDFQVKIRGYRVELKEIEYVLDRLTGIKKSLAACKQDNRGENYLVAYYTMKADAPVNENSLKRALSGKLPDYMVPELFMKLEEFPFTLTGKIDRKRLPEPDTAGLAVLDESPSPRTTLEKGLARVWSEVLGINQELLRIDQNFFAMGGHSLKATILVSKIHQALNVKVPLTEVFRTPTIRQLAQYIHTAARERYAAIKPAEKRQYYDLSSAQKRLYIIHQMDLEGTAYNMWQFIPLEHTTSVGKLEEAFIRLIDRHESLRTSFHVMDDQPVQMVHDHVAFEIEIFGRGLSLRDFIRPFDLSHESLLRVGLMETGEGKRILMVDMHHIISDGISRALLKMDFSELYEGNTLPPLRIQYKDFSQWQNSEGQTGNISDQATYWINQFEGEIPVLQLPIDYPRPAVQSFEGSSFGFGLSGEASRDLRAVALETGSTLFMILLSLTTILLSKLSGQEDIVIGTPIAGRRHADLEKIIGMFVNTLALRNYPMGRKTVKEFLEEIKKQTLNAFENQEYPFEELVEKLDIQRDVERNPLFDVMFSLVDVEAGSPAPVVKESNEVTEILHEYEQRISKFDLSLGVAAGERLFVSFEYCTALFKKETIQRFIGYFKEILHAVTQDIEVKISAIEILSGEEKKQLLVDFNNTVSHYSKDTSVHQLFQQQVEKTPHHVAVKFENNNVTYSELNRRANHLAVQLRDKGIRLDSIVTIMVDRCIEMFTGVLGVLKAGGAYLPIDLDYPESRIQYILEDSRSALVLVNRYLPDRLKSIIPMEQLDPDESFAFEGDVPNPDRINGMENLAYVIYTSGSTGKPKGVMVEHRNVAAYLHAYGRVVEFYSNDVIIQQSSFAFDAFVEEVYPILLKGGGIVISKNHEVLDPHLFSRFILKHNITLIVCAPLLLNEYNKWVGEHNQTPLRLILSGGDELKPGYIDNLLKAGTVYNAYGPTETTVCITYYKCPGDLGSTVPIGAPIANYRVYILDKNNRLLPIGVAGELCAAGDGVTRGYLNQPELTNEKFDVRSSTFEMEMHSALYHTGDLARWMTDGNIEFLGRIDHQVKIRGYRIELGEIENRLLKHQGVLEAIVVAGEDKSGDKYICAYVVPLEGDIISGEKSVKSGLREYLSENVPDYMVPSYFVELGEIPLTTSGKIDKNALPLPGIETKEEYIAPANIIEETLATIWSEVLSIKKDIISTDANFFGLGGHSLKATQLLNKMYKSFNLKITLMDFFGGPTIGETASLIRIMGWADEEKEGTGPAPESMQKMEEVVI